MATEKINLSNKREWNLIHNAPVTVSSFSPKRIFICYGATLPTYATHDGGYVIEPWKDRYCQPSAGENVYCMSTRNDTNIWVDKE